MMYEQSVRGYPTVINLNSFTKIAASQHPLLVVVTYTTCESKVFKVIKKYNINLETKYKKHKELVKTETNM